MLLLVLCVGILIVFLWYLHFYVNTYRLRKIPSPANLPILGCAFELADTQNIPKILDKCFEKNKTKSLRITVGLRTVLLTRDYKFAETIFSNSKFSVKSRSYRFFHPLLGDGLLTSTGEKWYTHRKILTPSFHFKILEKFVEVFVRNSNILVDKLKDEVGRQSFDVRSYISLCALDIICESAMGTKVNAQSEGVDSLYVKSVKETITIAFNRHYNPFFHFDWIFKLSLANKRQQRALEVLHKHTDNVIRIRKRELQDYDNASFENLQESEDKDFGMKKRFAFLDMLLRAEVGGRGLSDIEIRDEVSSFMFAGHDTVATTIEFLLYILANKPQEQAKVYEEISSLGDTSSEKTYSNIQNLKYLDLVIKETMRLYPAVPILGRTSAEESVYDGMTIPANTNLAIYIYGLHRDPAYFPDPEQFMPERFSKENYDSSRPYAYVPFSAGQRNCLGQRFAMLQMKCMISIILRQYELLPANPRHEIKVVFETLISSLNGIRIRIKKRQI